MEKEIYIDWIVNVLLYNNSSDKQTLQSSKDKLLRWFLKFALQILDILLK